MRKSGVFSDGPLILLINAGISTSRHSHRHAWRWCAIGKREVRSRQGGQFAWCGGVENTWKYPNPSKSIQILHRKWWIFGKTSIWGSIFSCFLCGGPGSQRAKSPSVADLSVRFHPRWKKFCTELPEMRRKKSRKSERNGFGYSTRIYQIGSLRVSMAPNFETISIR